MTARAVATVVTLLLAGACGGSDGGTAQDLFGGDDDSGSSPAGTIDACALLTAADLEGVLGSAPAPEESEPAGPFTGCSWGTGDVLVSIASSDSVILAPGEDECPSAELGDESYACEQRIKFLSNGMHVTVSTIDPFITNEQLLALAAAVLPRLSG